MADTYTVKKDDTLSEIAEANLSTIGVSTIKEGTDKIQELNYISNTDYIVVGQVLKLNGTAEAKKTNTTSKATIKLFGLQSNTDRTMYATWTWSKSNTENYRVIWYYDTGDDVWFIGNDSTVEDNQCTYSAPSNALRVKFKVKPISEKRTVNDTETAYWTAGWSTEKTYDFSNNPPTTPAVPTVEIKNYTLTMSLTNLDVNASQIQFKIVRIDGTKQTVFKTYMVPIKLTDAKYSCTVTAGYDYKVQCRSYRSRLYSDWSSYSSSVSAPPSTPKGFTTLKANSATSIYLAWAAVGSATSYTIEYTTDSKHFDKSSNTTEIGGIEGTEWIIEGLDADEYFFRIKAVNGIESGWSKVQSVTIGEPPAAPTTWSSTNTMLLGEKVNLYWVHNSKDGSGETFASLEMWIDNVHYPIGPLKKNEDDIGFITVDSSDGHVTIIPWGNESIAINTGYGFSDSIEWRVCTAGVTSELGEWSITRTIKVYEPPSLELNVVNRSNEVLDIIDTFPFYITALASSETQTPTSYHLSIIANEGYETVDNMGNTIYVNAGDQVYSKYVDQYARELLWEMTPGVINLENNINYTVKGTVSLDSGLTAESEASFTVSWTDIAYEPNAEIGINEDTYSATIRPYCEDENGDPIADILLSVYRREFDGTFTELITGVDNTANTFITDPHPALDYARYRVVATTKDTGAISYYDVPGYPVGGKCIVLQWDEDWVSFDGVNEDPLAEPNWTG